MTIQRFVRPGFFFLRHFTPGRQCPYHGLTDRSARHRKITPPPIFLCFWLPPPGQFTGAAAATNFYLGNEGQRRTKKKKNTPFLPFFLFFLKFFEIFRCLAVENKTSKVAGRSEKGEKKKKKKKRKKGCATAARRFWKPAAAADFASAHTSTYRPGFLKPSL